MGLADELMQFHLGQQGVATGGHYNQLGYSSRGSSSSSTDYGSCGAGYSSGTSPATFVPSPTPAPKLPEYWPYPSQEAHDNHQEEIRKAGGRDRYYFSSYNPLHQGKLVADWRVTPFFDGLQDKLSGARLSHRLLIRLLTMLVVLAVAATAGLTMPYCSAAAAAGWFLVDMALYMSRSAAWLTAATAWAVVRTCWLVIKWTAIACFWTAIAAAGVAVVYLIWTLFETGAV